MRILPQFGAFAAFALTLASYDFSRADTPFDASSISLPPGFSIEVFTDEVPNARSLALGANGTVFVSTRRDGRIYAVVPKGDKKPDVLTLASGLQMPNGIAFFEGDLFVAELTRISRYADIENRLDDPPQPELVAGDLPAERHHGWRYIGFGPDRMMYVSIGAPCNVCERDGFGVIVRQRPDGGGRETVAYGVRNSVGLAWHPQTGELWFTDNGRDWLGDDQPAGELNRLVRDGSHFGFPFCHGGDVLDPEFGAGKSCAEYAAPAIQLGPHVAPLGLTFYTGAMFPEKYRGQIFIAEHGSWNRSQKIGYRVTLVTVDNGRAVSYEPFAEGWLSHGRVRGRPVDVLEMPDGALLVSGDQEGRLYRISYSRPTGNSE